MSLLKGRAGGDKKRGEWAFIKAKKQIDFKIHFMGFKVFLHHDIFVCFPIKGVGGWVQTLNRKFHYYYFSPSLKMLNLNIGFPY